MQITTLSSIDQLFPAVQYLAGVCDGACDNDGQGFNKPDAYIGHSLAQLDKTLWDEVFARKAWIILRKYKGQLKVAGIDYDQIPEPPAVELRKLQAVSKQAILSRLPGYTGKFGSSKKERETVESKIWFDSKNSIFWVQFDKSRKDLLDDVRGISGRKFDWDLKAWSVPLTYKAAQSLIEVANKHEVPFASKKDLKRLEDIPYTAPSITLEDNRFIIDFEYDAKLVAQVKNALKRRGFDREKQRWTAPFIMENFPGILELCDQSEFLIDDVAYFAIHDAFEKAESNIEESRALAAELFVEGLGGTLRPFQKAGVAYAAKNKRTFIADGMGLGKTVQALAAVQHQLAYPCVVVCPSTVKYNWEREAKKWLPGKSVCVLHSKETAKKVNDYSADIIVVNYEILYKRKLKKKDIQVDTDVLNEIGQKLMQVNPKSFVLDESQYCKNETALRTRAVMALSALSEVVLLLSGTPVLNRPKELLTQLRILRVLEHFGGKWDFLYRYTAPESNGWGTKFNGASNLEELAEKLRAFCFIRREKEDVLTELPPKQRGVIPLPISNEIAYRKAAQNVVSFLGEQAKVQRDFLKTLKGLSKEERKRRIEAHRRSTEYKAAQAEQLVRLGTLKRLAAQGKKKAAFDWIRDFLETGEKLVLFADSKDMIDALMAEFGDIAVKVDGTVKDEDRQAAVDAFQRCAVCGTNQDDHDETTDCPGYIPNQEIRLFIGSKAAKEGITLTAATNVAFIEQWWTPGDHEQAEDRCHRLTTSSDVDAVNAWYLLGHNTIDNEVYEMIESKRVMISNMNEKVSSKLVRSLMEAAL